MTDGWPGPGPYDLPERRRHLNRTDDVAVEFRKVLSRYPVFGVDSATDLLHVVTAEIFSTNIEFGNEPGAALLHVPVLRNLGRISLIRYGVEDWLTR